jgi:hypothetical protein
MPVLSQCRTVAIELKRSSIQGSSVIPWTRNDLGASQSRTLYVETIVRTIDNTSSIFRPTVKPTVSGLPATEH